MASLNMPAGHVRLLFLPILPDDSEKQLRWRALAACSYRFCLTALTAKDARHCPNESQQVIP